MPGSCPAFFDITETLKHNHMDDEKTWFEILATLVWRVIVFVTKCVIACLIYKDLILK